MLQDSLSVSAAMMNYATVSKGFFFLIILMLNFQIVVALQRVAAEGRKKENLTIAPTAVQNVLIPLSIVFTAIQNIFYILISEKVHL
jgi:hypothetical protein